MSTPDILITAKPTDEHARAVQLALASIGKQVSRIDSQSDEFILHQSVPLPPIQAREIRRSTEPSSRLRAVWLWRPLPAPWEYSVGHQKPTPRDIEREYQRTDLLRSIEDNSDFVANRCTPALQLESKYRAVRAAQAVGLNTPATLITADTQALSEFFDAMNGRVVYKPHRQHRTAATNFIGTTKISAKSLEINSSPSLMPGIYQQFLDIAFEVRVLVLGQHTVAAKITNKSRFVDVRIMLGSINEVHPFAPPKTIQESCVRLIQENNLLTGSIDLAVTKDNEYYCLDINPFGKFLWMERYCSTLPVLDQFARFLSSADPGFRGARTEECKRLALSQFVC